MYSALGPGRSKPWLVGVFQFNPGITTKVRAKIKARAEDGAGQLAARIGAVAAEGEVGRSQQLTTPTYEVKLPHFIESIAECEDNERKTSIIMVDKRDDRIVSPFRFQAWLVREIMTNSSSSINVLTERDQVMPPQSGYHLSLFANYTLDGFKATVAISIDSQTGAPCGGWDPATANALSHVAFQPFSWIFAAGAQRHIPFLHGCEDLQWERDPVPLDLQRLSC